MLPSDTVTPRSSMPQVFSENSFSGTNGTHGQVTFDNLYPAILQCFVVVASGYIAGRLGHVTASQGRGIATFVSTFCLPALLFRSMCTLQFSRVNWHFLLAILIAKATVFVLVVLVTLLVKRPSHLGYAGLFAIFCTQSNDFALGYPMLQALYQDTHPEYLDYIYLIAPISLLMLNPIGFTLMEIHRHYSPHAESDSIHSSYSGPKSSDTLHHASGESEPGLITESGRHRKLSTKRTSVLENSGGPLNESGPTMCQAMLKVGKGVLFNPIVFMTIIGIVGNFVFKQTVPSILNNILNVLGDAFSACALFYLGLSMVGKVQSQIGITLLVPVSLIFVKTLLLPLVTWEIVSLLQPNASTSRSLSMYGFLYGTFPTAPSVVLYANQYEMGQHLVATGMVAGTFLSAPLMFVSAKMMTLVVSSDLDYKTLLFNTSFDTSIIGIICCIWVIGTLILSGRFRRVPHRFTLCLLLSQLLACIGMISYNEESPTNWRHYFQFVLLLIGVFSSRCWTAATALSLCLLHVRSLCFVLKNQVWLVFLGFGVPVLMTGLIFLMGATHISDSIDPSFHFGLLQTVFSLVVLVLSLLTTTVSIVFWQRNVHHHSVKARYSPLKEENSGIKPPAQSKPLENKPASPGAKNYNSCSLGAANIEDIISFPTTGDDAKSIMTDGCCGEDHDQGLGVSVDERTCLVGRCSTEERVKCHQRLRQYVSHLQSVNDSPQDEEAESSHQALQQEYQSTHHLLMLILLSVSMLMGLCLCIWKLFNYEASGIYVEIEFLDSVFNYGQSFLIFLVFGLDTRLVFSPIMRRIRRWLYGAELVRLPQPWELDEETKHTCSQFLNFHASTCQEQICHDRRFRLRKYQAVFTGAELCDWLMDAGLAADKAEAVAYGRRLLLGRVIAHVTGNHHFQHSPFFYQFVVSEDEDC